MDRLTVNLGVRWDRQADLARRRDSVPAQPGASEPPAGADGDAGRQRDRVERGHAAPRPDLRAEREPQDDRARELRDVRVAARRDGAPASSRRSSTRRSTTTPSTLTATRSRIPTRSCFGLGNVGYYGFDPLNPTRLDDDQPDRQLRDAEDARGHVRHRPRADAELRHQHHVHLPPLQPLQLERRASA